MPESHAGCGSESTSASEPTDGRSGTISTGGDASRLAGTGAPICARELLWCLLAW